MLNIGMIVDNRYKILRVLGRGGTSCVYLAENIRLHSFWAIKEVYKNSIVGTGANGNIFVAEASILTKLRHPGLPSIIDIIHTSDAYLIVMEYVEGVSLDKVLAQKGAQREKDVIRWGQQLCDVLTYLHSQRPAIIYRDMKPANIMLKQNGDVVLIDFGMAREFKSHSLHDTSNLGTHGYAAPEQYNGSRQTNARTDIYSLGITLYHLVTGRDPCLPPYGIQPIYLINPALSRKLDKVIQKATQLRMEDRFPSAADMRRALSQVYTENQAEVSLMAEDEEECGTSKAPWVILAVVISILLVLGIFGGILAGQGGWNDIGGDNGNFLEDLEYAIADMFQEEDDDAGLYYEQQVYVSYPDERLYYMFTPEKSGKYYIYSSSDEVVPVVWLLDEDDNIVMEDNTAAEYSDFSMICTLKAGQTYYIETTLYDLDVSLPATGYYYIYVEYAE